MESDSYIGNSVEKRASAEVIEPAAGSGASGVGVFVGDKQLAAFSLLSGSNMIWLSSDLDESETTYWD